MKISLLVILVIIFFFPVDAQQVSPRVKKNIENVSRALERASRKPQWQQKYDGHMAAGTTLMNQGEYAKAIKNFNIALSIVPNSQEAIDGRNYCRSMLPKKTPVRKKSTLQRYYEGGGL